MRKLNSRQQKNNKAKQLKNKKLTLNKVENEKSLNREYSSESILFVYPFEEQ